MTELSKGRLLLLRAMYLVVVIGLVFMIWPLLLNQPDDLEHMRGVVWSMLAGVSVLAALGLRHPIRMLPVLLFEFTWKVIWLVAIALPSRGTPAYTAAHQQSFFECLVGVVLLLILLPWPYVWRHYMAWPVTRVAMIARPSVQ